MFLEDFYTVFQCLQTFVNIKQTCEETFAFWLGEDWEGFRSLGSTPWLSKLSWWTHISGGI